MEDGSEVNKRIRPIGGVCWEWGAIAAMVAALALTGILYMMKRN
jgi:hypothetical protein